MQNLRLRPRPTESESAREQDSHVLNELIHMEYLPGDSYGPKRMRSSVIPRTHLGEMSYCLVSDRTVLQKAEPKTTMMVGPEAEPRPEGWRHGQQMR